jgi:hypothetical protein
MSRSPPLTLPVTADDQVKAYIKKIMSQLKDWMYGGKISKLVIVITSKETGEHVERWQFDVRATLTTRRPLIDTLPGPDIRENCKGPVVAKGRRQRELRAPVSADASIRFQR